MSANQTVYTRPSVIVERIQTGNKELFTSNSVILCELNHNSKSMSTYLQVDKFDLSKTHFDCMVDGGVQAVIQKIKTICSQMQIQLKVIMSNPFKFDAKVFFIDSPYICKFCIEILQFENSDEKSFVIDLSVKSNGVLGFSNIFQEFKERFLNETYVPNLTHQEHNPFLIKTIKSNEDWISLVKALDELPITWCFLDSVKVIHNNAPAPSFVIKKLIDKATIHSFVLGLGHILELTETFYSFDDENLQIEGVSVYDWIDIGIKTIKEEDDISLNVGIKLLIKIASKSEKAKKIIRDIFFQHLGIIHVISMMKKSDWEENHELARIFETITQN